MNVTVVVPTFNEANNLPTLVGELFAQPVADLHLLIVDDESPDGTGKLADELATRTPGRMDVMHRTGLRGLGRAYVDGFRWALAAWRGRHRADGRRFFSFAHRRAAPGRKAGRVRCGRRFALRRRWAGRRASGALAAMR